MNLIKVESSNIDSIGYKDNNLFIKFKRGTIYEYENVPKELFEKMLSSESKGKFFNLNIKNKYE